MSENYDFEYRTIWLSDMVDDLHFLQSAGNEGWELVQIVPDPSSNYGKGGFQAFLKRYADSGMQTTLRQAQKMLDERRAEAESEEGYWTNTQKRFDHPPFDSELEESGIGGFELVTVVHDPRSGDFVAYFKKPGKSPEFQKFEREYKKSKSETADG